MAIKPVSGEIKSQDINDNLSYLDSKTNNISKGAPAGTYTTVALLTAAYPNGNINIYVITTTGNWHYWNGSVWAVGGKYQETSIGENSVNHDKMYMSYARGAIVQGGVNIDTVNKKITIATTTRVSYAMSSTKVVVNAGDVHFMGDGQYIFYNLSNSKIEIYPIGNFAGVTTSYNNLIWLATLYFNRLYDVIDTNFWTLNDSKKGLTEVLNVQSQSLMTSSTTGAVVTFDADNKTITIPQYALVYVNGLQYQLATNQVIDLKYADAAYNARVLILFDTQTGLFKIDRITSTSYTPPENQTVLGSFYQSWESAGARLKFKHIAANFAYDIVDSDSAIVQSFGVWQNKIANFIGDSITAGQNGNTYIEAVKDILGLSNTRNYGVGGTSLCYRESIHPGIDDTYPPVVTRYKNMDDNADIIFMLIGTNDYSSQVPLGAIDSIDANDFNGGLNVVIKGLKDKYPAKTIIISTLLNRLPKNGTSIKIDDYNSAIKDACKRHCVICYDLNTKSGLDLAHDFTSNAKKITTDGLHPNTFFGANILGQRVAGFINTN